jgi:hypothetical protein
MLGSALARRLHARPDSELILFGEPFHVAGIIETGGEEEDQTTCAWRCCSD